MTIVLILAVMLVFLANAVFYGQAETFIVDDARIARFGEALSTDLRVLAGAPATERQVLAVMLSGPELTLSWDANDTSLPRAERHPSYDLGQLTQRLVESDQTLLRAHLRLEMPRSGSPTIQGMMQLPDGSLVRFRAPRMLGHHVYVNRGLTSAAIVAVAVILAAAILLRGVSMPLRALAAVADRIGSNETWVPLDERGPREVRGLARAMNAMQKRIQSLINARTQALAAVSHDLRTPLTRLRLRSGFLQDSEAQASIEADLDEMEAMVNSVLAYLAGAEDPEQLRPTNLVATLTTLVDDHADRGRDARYEGPDRALVRVRPIAMKRVLSNLIENALNYGGNVLATLERGDDGEVRVMIRDNGPGIPESEYERVLTPFYRLEGSRSRETGGMGLGLAIVTREVAREGARLKLGRGDPATGYGGLCVTITFPPPPVPPPSRGSRTNAVRGLAPGEKKTHLRDNF